MLGGLLKWSRESVSYMSPAMHVVEGISVVETMTAKADPGECQQREDIRGNSDGS